MSKPKIRFEEAWEFMAYAVLAAVDSPDIHFRSRLKQRTVLDYPALQTAIRPLQKICGTHCVWKQMRLKHLNNFADRALSAKLENTLVTITLDEKAWMKLIEDGHIINLAKKLVPVGSQHSTVSLLPNFRLERQSK